MKNVVPKNMQSTLQEMCEIGQLSPLSIAVEFLDQAQMFVSICKQLRSALHLFPDLIIDIFYYKVLKILMNHYRGAYSLGV